MIQETENQEFTDEAVIMAALSVILINQVNANPMMPETERQKSLELAGYLFRRAV